MATRPNKRKLPPNPYLTAATPEQLDPAGRIAFEIVADRRDLLVSVERIMNAGLNEAGTVGALSSFRDAIGATGDPNRDPRVAIAAQLSIAGVETLQAT
jgi:hypothetical protein